MTPKLPLIVLLKFYRMCKNRFTAEKQGENIETAGGQVEKMQPF